MSISMTNKGIQLFPADMQATNIEIMFISDKLAILHFFSISLMQFFLNDVTSRIVI